MLEIAIIVALVTWYGLEKDRREYEYYHPYSRRNNRRKNS